MSSKQLTKKQKQKKWDEYFEEKQQLRDVVRVKTPTSDTQRFLQESRLSLLEEALGQSAYDSPEFNSILESYVDIFLELNNLGNHPKDEIIKRTKDRLLKDEIVGEFDGKKLPDPDPKWPKSGRISLRQAIDPKYLGRKKSESRVVNQVFGGDLQPGSYNPTPSSKEKK